MSEPSNKLLFHRAHARRGRSLFPFVFGILFGIAAGVGAFFAFRAILAHKPPDLMRIASRPATRTAPPTPVAKEPPIPMEAIQSCFDLSITVAAAYPAAELIVMTDRQPLGLQAAAVRNGTLPAGFREVGPPTIRWVADAGQVLAGASQGDSSAGQFMPPEDSRMVTVRAILEPAIVQAGQGSGGQPIKVSVEKTVRILTPVDSGHMVNWRIDGYEVGEYLDPKDPTVAKRFNVESDWYQKYPDRFSVPKIFYKVDSAWKDLKISPNLTIGFFTIDFPWKSLGMPQYIALDWNLVTKLEDLIALMRADGRQVSRLVPIYGFRPPAFNLGTIEERPGTNLKVPFSLHQYGCAVDVIIDENNDNQLDDLNGDGVVDIHDAAVIMHYVNILDRQYREQKRMGLVGGAGLYTHNDFVERTEYLKIQTPYIHIDTRGFVRDNGTLIRWPDAWPGGQPIQWSKI